MSCCINDLRNKDVINICDGKRLGCIVDVEVDVCSGRLVSVIVPGDDRLFCLKRNEIRIPWDRIERIGDDAILVNLPLRSKDGGDRRPEKH